MFRHPLDNCWYFQIMECITKAFEGVHRDTEQMRNAAYYFGGDVGVGLLREAEELGSISSQWSIFKGTTNLNNYFGIAKERLATLAGPITWTTISS